MTDISRRKFLGLFGGAAAAVAIPMPAEATAVIEEIPVEYGFTWHAPKEFRSFSDIIVETLRENKHMLHDNVCKHNALLLKMKGHDNKVLRIERISEELQTQRMTERLNQRLHDRNEARKKSSREDVLRCDKRNRELEDGIWKQEYE